MSQEHRLLAVARSPERSASTAAVAPSVTTPTPQSAKSITSTASAGIDVEDAAAASPILGAADVVEAA
eukprot:10831824-Heterocapsa_arctica.AAC.1